MKRMLSVAAIMAVPLLPGCMTSHRSASSPGNPEQGMFEASGNPVTPISLCTGPEGCTQKASGVVHGEEIGRVKNAPDIAGHPLTSVVVTQCNLVVAVYMTMPDGRFLRFDQKANVSAEELVTIAYSATHSERVEVSCEGTGVVAYEKHEPV